MGAVIALRGLESEKIINQQRRKVVPFVGTDHEGEFAEMGIGFLFSDNQKAKIWGLVSPHMVK